MIRTCVTVAAVAFAAVSAGAQSCGTIAGGSTCGPPTRGGPIDYSKRNSIDDPRDRGGSNYLSAFSGSSSGLGNELSGNYAPTTFGAFTLGAGGARCSGLFRSRVC